MIHAFVKGDVLSSAYSNICFAVNTEGYNDAGFAGLVARQFWPGLDDTGPKELGDVMTHRADNKRVFHALVCHSLKSNGWEKTPTILTECLDKLDLPRHAAIVLVGGGMIDQMGGANVWKNLHGIAQSKHNLAVFSL